MTSPGFTAIKNTKSFFHVDSAPSHRAALTQEYFKQQKLKYIPAKEWMPYSSNMAPMDYAINGNLKTNLKRRVARDRGQLVRAVRYEWSKIKNSHNSTRTQILANTC